MLKIVRKLFDWTPSDVAAWEKIRKKGLRKFTVWYGLAFSGILLLVMGVVTFFIWFQAALNFASLLFQLAFVVIVCLLGGLIASLWTWWLEERIYRKIMRSRSPQ